MRLAVINVAAMSPAMDPAVQVAVGTPRAPVPKTPVTTVAALPTVVAAPATPPSAPEATTYASRLAAREDPVQSGEIEVLDVLDALDRVSCLAIPPDDKRGRHGCGGAHAHRARGALESHQRRLLDLLGAREVVEYLTGLLLAPIDKLACPLANRLRDRVAQAPAADGSRPCQARMSLSARLSQSFIGVDMAFSVVGSSSGLTEPRQLRTIPAVYGSCEGPVSDTTRS